MTKALTLLFLSIVIIVAPLFPMIFSGIFKREEGIAVTTIFAILLLIIAYVHQFLPNKKRDSIAGDEATATDILLLAYLTYITIHLLYIRNIQHEPILAIKGICLISGYILSRGLCSQKQLLVTIATSGFVQSIICFGQLGEVLESNHPQFSITGTFMNPGPLGGFLAISLIASIGLMLIVDRKNKRIIAVASLCIISALALSDSRSAWIAACMGSILMYVSKWRGWLNANWKKTIIISSFTTLIIGWILFSYRPASIYARLLIWRVSGEMFADKPLLGHGIESFSRQYMKYQEQYFATHPISEFIPVANNVTYPYNEPLRIAVEQGFIGLSFFIFLILLIIKQKSSDPAQQTIACCIVGWGLFSLFSYPVDTFTLLLLLCILIANIQLPHIRLKVPTIPFARHIYPASLFGALYLSIYTLFYYHNAAETVKNAIRFDSALSSENPLSELSEKLKYNLPFSQIYFHYCLKQDTGRVSFEECVFPNSELYCRLGDYYEQRKQYDKAGQYYISASNMVPNRLFPNFCLYKLYLSTGDSAMALHVAQKALNQFIKVESTFTISAKKEVKDFIKEMDKRN